MAKVKINGIEFYNKGFEWTPHPHNFGVWLKPLDQSCESLSEKVYNLRKNPGIWDNCNLVLTNDPRLIAAAKLIDEL